MSNGVYGSAFILTAGSASNVVSDSPLPAANATDVAPSQFQVNARIAALPPPVNYLPIGGDYAQLVSKASAADYDLQFADYWTDITVPLAGGQTISTDASPQMTNFVGSIQLPAFQGAITGTESLHLNLQFPHSWRSGSDVRPHMHYARGPTGAANAYGSIAIVVPSAPELSGTYLYAASTGYINSSSLTVIGTSSSNHYAIFYEQSKNITLIWYTNLSPARYVLATGNWTTAGAHGTLVQRPLNSNAGTLTSVPTYYVSSIGTFKGAQVGPYTAMSGGGTPYTYAKLDVSSLAYPSVSGTYLYTSDDVSVSFVGSVYVATTDAAAPYHSVYYSYINRMTIVYSLTDGCYVFLNGNVAFPGASGTLVQLLSGNTSSIDTTRAGSAYRIPSIGTFNNINLYSYASTLLSRFLFEYS